MNQNQKPDTSKKQPPAQPGQVGSVTDTATKQNIPIVPRKGESDDHAIDRTQDKHVKK